jgi:transketolase
VRVHLSKKLDNDLRLRILDIIVRCGEGHIPSSFSIIEILNFIYSEIITSDSEIPKSLVRDYFILSKGHGAAALYVVLEKFGYLSENELNNFGTFGSILGGHPDSTKVPGVEASTGSLGHGMPFATGIALGLKIQNSKGTIWESANIAANHQLSNLTVVVDWNGSAQQLLPIENLGEKWRAFGWAVEICDGHSKISLRNCFKKLEKNIDKPKLVLAKTIKGKGAP